MAAGRSDPTRRMDKATRSNANAAASSVRKSRRKSEVQPAIPVSQVEAPPYRPTKCSVCTQVKDKLSCFPQYVRARLNSLQPVRPAGCCNSECSNRQQQHRLLTNTPPTFIIHPAVCKTRITKHFSKPQREPMVMGNDTYHLLLSTYGTPPAPSESTKRPR